MGYPEDSMRSITCITVLLFVWMGGCGGDDDGPSTTDAGGAVDSGRGDGGTSDGGPRDTGIVGDPCGDVVCDPFEFCDEFGMCRAYRGCVATTMCAAGEICRHRFCLPEDADIDDDSDPASVDCDETNPTIGPSSPEVCNGVDDDCDEMIDEGDPGELCAMDPSGGVCMDGTCGCPPGTFDLDREPTNGCECTAMPASGQGESCTAPIDLGDLSDVGTTMTVAGNVLPDDREVWYRFRAVDEADTMCDNFHVRVRFTTNPLDVYGFEIYMGDCSTASCMTPGLYDDFDWATDFSDAMAMTGECPCAPTTDGVNHCDDDTTEDFVRVVRRPGTDVACDSYALELTNGIYDTP
jgi:hypothetical protein